MREILFRGKRVYNGEWVYGDLVSKKYILQGYKVNGGYVVPYNTFEVIPETVGQFTGLTDKNGKRIFEGDIIIFNRDRNLPNSFSCPRVVFYDERNVQFTTYASPYATLQKDMMSECEVVGNIHDNPDLLEVV